MRIIIATPFYPPQGGSLSAYAAGLEAAFKKLGHDVQVVSFNTTLPPGVRHAAYFLSVLKVLRGASFVLVLDTWSVGMPAFFAARLCGVPSVFRIGGDVLWESYVERTKESVRLSEFYGQRNFSLKERLIHAFNRVFVRGAKALFFNSRFQLDLWRKEYGFPETRARVLENYYPSKGTIMAPRGRVFVGAGRPIILKNGEGLERAFAAVKTRYPDIELDVRLLPPAEHRARLASAYAVVIPSVSEMSANMAIDAVTAGKPFIMTDDTGTKERLGDCGIFIDTRDDVALERAIEQMLDPAEYERLATTCAAFSWTHSWDDMAGEILRAV